MDDRRLRKLFQFAEQDLFANRDGRLSESQKKKLEMRWRADQKSARESAVILFVVAAIGLAFGLLLSLTAPSAGSRLFFVLVLCVLWPVAWGGRAARFLWSARVVNGHQLRTVHGRVHIISHADPSGSVEYTLQVGDMEFDVERNPTGALEEGEECVAYYLTGTEEILSVEVRFR